MARTKTPPAPAPAPPTPPPDPPTQEVARPSPVLAWPSEWPVPEMPEPTRKRGRGLPMGPVLAGASNGTALTATAAYSAGGPVAAAATGALIVAGATAAAVRRRAAVRRSVAARSGGATPVRMPRSGGGSGVRSGSGGGAIRGGSGSRRSATGVRSGAGSALRSGAGRSGGGALAGSSRGGRRGGLGSAGGRSGSGLFGKGAGRHVKPGRSSDLSKALTPKQKKAAEKAAAKAVKNAAKNAAAKALTAKASKTNGHAVKAAAARAARAAYNTARPHAARARKMAASHTRRAGGALWDGLCAAGAAARQLVRRGRAGALDRLKAVWKRRRENRKDADTPTAPDTQTVADTVRRPTHTTPASTGGPHMSGGGHHFVAAATEMARAAAAYQPTGMLQVGQDFSGLEEALRIHAEALKTTVENADANWPLAPQIIELMRQIHGLQLKAAELASELQPAFRQLHDVDITRLENPRTGERMWDFASNL